MLNQINCPYCNNYRTKNLKEKCSNCGRRKFLLFGYRNREEIRLTRVMMGIMSVEVLTAIITGVLYLINTRGNL